MADMEPFTFVDEASSSIPPPHLFNDVLDLNSAKSADHDLQYIKHLRTRFPEMIVTAIPTGSIPLLSFASAGFATYTVDKDTDSYASWRGYIGPSAANKHGSLAESVHFAKYVYHWSNENFIVYVVGRVQYVLKERRAGEDTLGPSKVTDALITAAGSWLYKGDVVWVYDDYWYQDANLYREVMKMSWDKVILDEDMKAELTSVAEKFFDSKDVYEDLGVPWKRGLMFYGPPGNGKTISIKALMGTLLRREDRIPTLYVKNAPQAYDINQVFAQARNLAPCMLVLEDIETIVRSDTRSYFFNQMDGLENNDGLFVVGSTNYLERLDPGLTKRPSRFDRKYLFPIPNEHERTLYCQYWRKKVSQKKEIEFPAKLCPAMAHITPGFSFAFLQECFVATLLTLARQRDGKERDDDDLERYELWRVFKKQADILRKEIDSQERPMNPPPQPRVVAHTLGAERERQSSHIDVMNKGLWEEQRRRNMEWRRRRGIEQIQAQNQHAQLGQHIAPEIEHSELYGQNMPSYDEMMSRAILRARRQQCAERPTDEYWLNWTADERARPGAGLKDEQQEDALPTLPGKAAIINPSAIQQI